MYLLCSFIGESKALTVFPSTIIKDEQVWDLPYSLVMDSENAEQAVRRMAFDQIGVIVGKVNFVSALLGKRDNDHNTLVLTYRSLVAENIQLSLNESEFSIPTWYGENYLPSLVISGREEIVRDYLAKKHADKIKINNTVKSIYDR